MKEIVLKIKGMHCEGCENRIQNAISQIGKVKKVIANHVQGCVTISYTEEINLNEIKEIIEDLGFEVEDNEI